MTRDPGDYRVLLESAVNATVIHSLSSFSWFGAVAYDLPLKVKRSLDLAQIRQFLLYQLQTQLYNNFYSQGWALPGRWRTIGANLESSSSFVNSLSAANSGSGWRQSGWQIAEIHEEFLVLTRDNLRVRISREHCLFESEPLAVNQTIGVRSPKEHASLLPGFYMAFGDYENLDGAREELVRVYWNINPEGAAQLIAAVTLACNQVRIPFQLKVLSEPSHFTRCDAGVLYFRGKDFPSISDVISDLYPKIRNELRPRTPAFTKHLMDGVGLAEDTGEHGSFGTHRCQLVAEGLVRALELGRVATLDRMEAVIDRFEEEGIEIDQPFLNPGSIDKYIVKVIPQTRTSGETQTVARSDAYLSTAYEIGCFLVKDAIWHNDQCNWMGAEPYGLETRDETTVVYRALNPDLYAGTSGVALFLASLFSLTGDVKLLDTSRAAMRNALDKVVEIKIDDRLGLFGGWLGVAASATRVGLLLKDSLLLDLAEALFKKAKKQKIDNLAFDLLSGKAGAILALIFLQRVFPQAACLSFASQLADSLIRNAQKSSQGYSWKSAVESTGPNLTGLSHGASGAGYALLELFKVTGRSKYRDASEQAFRYERGWFDARLGNWPDLRGVTRSSKRQPLSYATYWCHGAPGIALCRLRAYEILGDEIYQAEAVAALNTTREAVKEALISGTENYSLCHGLAGNGTVLLHGSRVLKEDAKENLALALEVADIGIKRFGQRNNRWPCGNGPGQNQSLMLGLAGIGYFYLLLRDSKMPLPFFG